tara:strand:+ start:349 stop:840 length:492 start_codon:yes stop_codon:yes gene_type:complete
MSEEKTHWMQNPNKNYLGHWDLPPSGDMTAIIKSANWEDVKNPKTGKTENKRVVRFEGSIKPLICNEINATNIYKATGIKFIEDSKGAVICLYVGVTKDNSTKEDIDCVRVRLENPYSLSELQDLRSVKADKLKDSIKNRIDEIIKTKEVSSYEKAIKTIKDL